LQEEDSIMLLRLYNTRTRLTEEFTPLDPGRVTMYLCGPTVYNYVHIGNARGPVVFGVLVRLLKRIYGAQHVIYARNVTDVDDKINNAAAKSGVAIDVITRRYAAAYDEDMLKLGVDAPDVVPYATQHIPQIIAMCEQLIASGHAYAAQDHVLFDVSSYADYGHLSRRSREDKIDGARVEVAPYKKNPADFVLWKPSTPELPGWDSPWGRGRPGWHIECSAMSATHLGETIDIHAGGNDLMFPHHENEVAQSTCAHGGKVFARWWLHNGMLTFAGKKMSKSLGNTLELHTLLQQHPPELLRYMLMKAHYRQPLDWSDDSIAQARATLAGWYGALRDLADIEIDRTLLASPDEEVITALCDDLNTPEAFAVIARWATHARRAVSREHKIAAKSGLLRAGHILGLLQQDPEEVFKGGVLNAKLPELQVFIADEAGFRRHVDHLVEQRTLARKAKDFKKADEIRLKLAALNVVVEDTPKGPQWKLANTNECQA
jgi:cysteinyl-tRNA synthetase